MTDDEHLKFHTSDRGLKYMPTVPSRYGEEVKVYESSSASGPHIWLNVKARIDANKPMTPMNTMEATVLLKAGDAKRLSEQLEFLVHNHYQGCEEQ